LGHITRINEDASQRNQYNGKYSIHNEKYTSNSVFIKIKPKTE